VQLFGAAPSIDIAMQYQHIYSAAKIAKYNFKNTKLTFNVRNPRHTLKKQHICLSYMHLVNWCHKIVVITKSKSLPLMLFKLI